MRSVRRVSAFAALSVLLLAGCRRERTSEVSFVVTPDLASRTATVECKASSTGVCHFTFSSEASPSELSVKAGEIIASMLLTWHNLRFYQDLMAELREAIERGDSEHFAASFQAAYAKAENTQDSEQIAGISGTNSG